MGKPRLVEPSTRWAGAVRHALTTWDAVEHHGFALHLADGVDLATDAGFARWVELLIDDALHPRPGLVTSTNRWIVRGDDFLGAVQLRHSLGTEYLRRRGGHIGYGIVPAHRGRGFAGFAVAGMLDEARRLGMARVLVTCAPGNAASARVIERAGGVAEHGHGEPDILRYWIEL